MWLEFGHAVARNTMQQEVRNIRILLEYDGTPYMGWQHQQGFDTVQKRVEDALASIVGTHTPVNVAGRTDAGVHAVGQVLNFKTSYRLEPHRYAPALNRYLPDTISVHNTEEVPLDFDARRSATSKRYRYRVYQAKQRAAHEATRAWYLPKRLLDVSRMEEASRVLLGELDFESFRSAHCDAKHAIRTMHGIQITQYPRPPCGHFTDIVFHANAFCRHMCRILAGTLVEVGYGARSVESVQEALNLKKRQSSGMTAPACGLTLLEVVYAERRLV
jgi:tRNA pseudouridine38-40 synthase